MQKKGNPSIRMMLKFLYLSQSEMDNLSEVEAHQIWLNENLKMSRVFRYQDELWQLLFKWYLEENTMQQTSEILGQFPWNFNKGREIPTLH